MDLRQIRYFVAACDSGSFSAAADRMHCTASGISQQMAALEDRLGTELFERTRRGVRPNAAGRLFYDHCLGILRAVAAAEIDLEDFHAGRSGSVAAGFVPGLARAVLPQVLARFTSDYPRIDIDIGTGSADTLIDQVAASQIDFYVGQFSGPQSGLELEPLGRFPVTLIAGARLGLSSMQPLDLGTLPPLKLFLPGATRSLRSKIEEAIAAKAIPVERILTIHSLSAGLEFLSQTDWAAILPFWIGLKELANPALTVHPILSPQLHVDLAMIHPLRQPLAPPARQLFSRFAQELGRFEAEWAAMTGQR